MQSNLLSEHKLARRGTSVGATILYAVAAVALLAEALHCLVIVSAELPGTWGDPFFEVLLVLSQLAAIGAVGLLGGFLRHFCAHRAPFGGTQSARLIVASTLLVGCTALDVVLACAFHPVEPAPVPLLSFAIGTQFVLRLLALAVFFGCLAMVVRYGNALKEDSDSIV